MASMCPIMGGRTCLKEKCMLFIAEDDPNDEIEKNACAIAVIAGASTSADCDGDHEIEVEYFSE